MSLSEGVDIMVHHYVTQMYHHYSLIPHTEILYIRHYFRVCLSACLSVCLSV